MLYIQNGSIEDINNILQNQIADTKHDIVVTYKSFNAKKSYVSVYIPDTKDLFLFKYPDGLTVDFTDHNIISYNYNIYNNININILYFIYYFKKIENIIFESSLKGKHDKIRNFIKSREYELVSIPEYLIGDFYFSFSKLIHKIYKSLSGYVNNQDYNYLYKKYTVFNNTFSHGINIDQKLVNVVVNKFKFKNIKNTQLKKNINLISYIRDDIRPGTSMIYPYVDVYTTADTRVYMRGKFYSLMNMNKSHGMRNIFTSRWSVGQLIEYDYNAFHLRIMTNILGMDKLNKSSDIYPTLVGRDISHEERNEAKRDVFEVLYGHSSTDNPYLTYIKEHLNWKFIKEQVTPQGRRLTTYNKNYINIFMRMYEVDYVMHVLEQLHNTITPEMKFYPIIYFYDSIIFDVFRPTENYLLLVKGIMETSYMDYTFPTKLKLGKTLNKLKEV